MIRHALLALLLLTGCATADDMDEPGSATPRERYSGVGESPVGSIPDVILRDAQRGREVVMTIEYPTRGGPSPVIVFSHGFGGSNRGYVGLSSYWASQGYVVIKPTHADSGKLRDLQDVEDIWESQTPADWSARVRDVIFVIDSLEKLEEQYPELKGKIDRARVGVGGHSYGAHTAMLIGGGRTFPGGARYADPRVKAIVAMSPQGPAANRGLTNESWAELKVPALFMTGTLDGGVTEDETPEWRRQAFALAPAGDKWFVSVEGARHASFSGRRSDLLERYTSQDTFLGTDRERAAQAEAQRARTQNASGRERAIFESIRIVSLAFWDACLRGDAAGRELLEKAADRGLTVERK